MFEQKYNELKIKAENCIKEHFSGGGFWRLEKGMEYSLFAGGKRLRPIIMLYMSEYFGVDEKKASAFAAAVEMIHTYSLIHDDLPSLDNDDFRRGKPTNHKIFGDGFAVVNGDALLNLAYETVLSCLETREDISAARLLAKSAGREGMCSGQAADLYFEDKPCEKSDVDYINENKTGALLKACFVCPAAIAGRDDMLPQLSKIGTLFGEVFQIKDDLLDRYGESGKLGKSVGKDDRENKSTTLNVLGKEKTLDLIEEKKNQILYLTDSLGGLSFLHELTEYIVKREN